MEHPEQLTLLTGLQQLELLNNEDFEIWCLSRLHSLPVMSIGLWDPHGTDIGAAGAWLQGCGSKVTGLCFYGGLSQPYVSELLPPACVPRLVHLELQGHAGQKVYDEDLTHLVQFTNLTHLQLPEFQIDVKALSRLSALRSLQSLELKLIGCDGADVCMQSVACSLTQLTGFKLGYSNEGAWRAAMRAFEGRIIQVEESGRWYTEGSRSSLPSGYLKLTPAA